MLSRSTLHGLAGLIALFLLACHGREGEAPAVADGCGAAWLDAPAVDPSIAVPDGGGRAILHAAANGSQNYRCTRGLVDGGAKYTWAFVGPEASLSDCRAPIGSHFASDAGGTAPEWQTLEGSYVVGHKMAGFTPDGGTGDVPWLLIGATSRGGSSPLGQTHFIQRVSTRGGLAPTTPCDEKSDGQTSKVPYTADYFFYGP
jgi:Protein of unknown function (DUF3455)